jgi:excisionase family DNA binding protein
MQHLLIYAIVDTQIVDRTQVPRIQTRTDSSYFTVGQAARMLAVSPSTVWRWIDSGKLSAYRVGGRAIRIKKEDLAAVMNPVKHSRNEETMPKEVGLFTPPTLEELARRQAVVAEILANRKERVIAPMTAAQLVHKARAREQQAYGKPG